MTVLSRLRAKNSDESGKIAQKTRPKFLFLDPSWAEFAQNNVPRPATIRAGAGIWKTPSNELARRLMTGDAGRFDRFRRAFPRQGVSIQPSHVRPSRDAEEVAQDTLLKVFESFDQLREPERVRQWVFRIAKNACLMKRRKSVFAPGARAFARRASASDE